MEENEKQINNETPPDKNSHDLKVARVNYQTYLLLNYDKLGPFESPLNHGWTLEDGSCKPIRYNQPALPLQLQGVISELPESTGTDSSGSASDSNEDDME